jgi:signal-transduction protein with cAMP-binding, CBS, and nucleotidyltransferase domain
MAEGPKVVGRRSTPVDVARTMVSHDIGSVPVVDEGGRLVGIVTDRDLVVRVIATGRDPASIQLDEVATTKNVVTIGPDQTVSEARDAMAEHHIKRLPVVKGDELVGVIALGDVAVTSASAREVGEAVADIFRSPATEDVRGERPEQGTPERVKDERAETTAQAGNERTKE